MENKNAKTEYEVVFVVYGNVLSEDADIGDIEVSGFVKTENGEYALKDGRLWFSVETSSLEEAYEKGEELLEQANVGVCNITETNLEHIWSNDIYWYKEDLGEGKEME